MTDGTRDANRSMRNSIVLNFLKSSFLINLTKLLAIAKLWSWSSMCLYLVVKWPESRGEFISALLKQGGLILFSSLEELFREVPQSLHTERLPWCFLQTWIFLCSFWMFLIVIYGLYLFVLMTVVDQLLDTSCLPIGPRHFPPDHCSPPDTSQPDFPFLVCVAATVTEVWIWPFVLSCLPYSFSYLII